MVDENQKIGIVLLMTNAYFPLGVRFVKRFMQFYRGNSEIKFFLFSDCDPKDYLPEGIDYLYIHTTNKNWVDGTNLKFSSILSLMSFYPLSLLECKEIYYFDSDTNVDKEFTEEWFSGELVAGQHYADQSWMKEKKGFERNPRSKAYIPHDTPLPQMYFYGAMWGGSVENVIKFCQTMLEWQIADKSWGYEPAVNDESFSNCYFHYNPPTKVVLTSEFKFLISDKGGIGETRNVHLNIEKLKEDLLLYKDRNIDIKHGKVVLDE